MEVVPKFSMGPPKRPQVVFMREGSHVGCQGWPNQKSVAAHQAALDRMKKEGKKHLTKVFKAKKGKFALQPKEGTAAYKKKMKKMA